MSEPATEPAKDVVVVQGKQAKAVYLKAKRVAAWKANNAGVLAVAADRLQQVALIFRAAAEDNARVTEQEVRLALAFAKRLARRAGELARANASGMHEALKILDEVSRHLAEADKGGYGIRRLQQKALADRALLDKLRHSLRTRVAESAAVLAELEQAVDPVPGFNMVSGRKRAENAKARKQALTPLQAAVALPDPRLPPPNRPPLTSDLPK